jgi:CPA1 family monovalent cation:H+ antiporter
LAAVIARYMPSRTSARDRVNSYSVWAAVVFVLNVLAFLLMGLQARDILAQLQSEALSRALTFALIVLGIVIGVRFAYIMLYGVVLRWFRRFFEPHLHSKPPTVRIGILVSWCGMRGLVTLATSLALPQQFPGRDIIVLSAFTVVLGTLVLQGFTIRPLISLLNIAPDSSLDDDVRATRNAMLDAAIAELAANTSEKAAAVRAEYGAVRAGSADRSQPNTAYDSLRMQAITAERRLLADWRRHGHVQDDAYHILENELDRAELHIAPGPNSALDG